MGRCKLVTYDLVKPETDYEDLISAIKAYPDWCHVQKSVWLISSDDGCDVIRDNLRRFMDSDDRIFVSEQTGVAAWYGAICKNDDVKRLLGS